MPLNGNDLGDAIQAAIDAVTLPEEGATPAYRQNVMRAQGNALVDYLIANTEVVGVAVSAVTAGVATSGPNLTPGTIQ